mmetsp:Transcript_8759/g.15390  ORF Transcript_8759/g.15390 Transcript_8759/m.15390 type:complete len:299 (-) Transcript_8759:44-940(-)
MMIAAPQEQNVVQKIGKTSQKRMMEHKPPSERKKKLSKASLIRATVLLLHGNGAMSVEDLAIELGEQVGSFDHIITPMADLGIITRQSKKGPQSVVNLNRKFDFGLWNLCQPTEDFTNLPTQTKRTLDAQGCENRNSTASQAKRRRTEATPPLPSGGSPDLENKNDQTIDAKLVLERMGRVQAEKKLQQIELNLKSVERFLKSCSDFASKDLLYVTSEMLQTALAGGGLDAGIDPQLLALRGPRNAQMTVNEISLQDTTTYTMSVQSPRSSRPLESYLLQKASLVDLFTPPTTQHRSE